MSSRGTTGRTTRKPTTGLVAGQTGTEEGKCTYPGDSVVMMGFSPSFFRFLFIAELPFEFEADAPAAGAGGCTDASFALSDPFMLAMEKKLDVGGLGGGSAHRRGEMRIRRVVEG